MRDVSAWSSDDQLRYHAARMCYRSRFELCPTRVDIDGVPTAITWATWFHRNFGVTLDEYQQQLNEGDTADAPEHPTRESGQPDSFAQRDAR
jgi:hypothetical protein